MPPTRQANGPPFNASSPNRLSPAPLPNRCHRFRPPPYETTRTLPPKKALRRSRQLRRTAPPPAQRNWLPGRRPQRRRRSLGPRAKWSSLRELRPRPPRCQEHPRRPCSGATSRRRSALSVSLRRHRQFHGWWWRVRLAWNRPQTNLSRFRRPVHLRASNLPKQFRALGRLEAPPKLQRRPKFRRRNQNVARPLRPTHRARRQSLE